MVREEFTEASKSLGIQSSILKLGFLKNLRRSSTVWMGKHLPKVAFSPEFAILHNMKCLQMPRKRDKGNRHSNEIVKTVHYSETRAG